ncbi:uncharacterized protein [Alexandromys fortis]|uniref:uncharacterized protein n=1 Tax=Alexandromys fortis TaxID=100897 RepID=UPI002153030B|nr:uncharacterized protein LOC126508687 [Microtus fortis]
MFLGSSYKMSTSKSKAHFSTQTLPKAAITINFFFSESFLNKHFQEVELSQGEPQPGDLYLFKLLSSSLQCCGTHVGVYCGKGEIIHFEGVTTKNGVGGTLQSLLEYNEGKVFKEGLRQMQRERKLSRVLRRRGGINHKDLELRVRKAMDNDPPEYNAISSNCAHFALNLLGMDSTLLGECCIFKFCSKESMSKPFQEVKLDQGNTLPGDVLLFKKPSSMAQSSKVHMGVDCGNGEIIHFDGKTSSRGRGQRLWDNCEGVVCKENLDALRSSGRLVHVLRQRSGIKTEELESRVQTAMTSIPPPYNDISSNSVHFALKLLGTNTN